MQQPEVGEGVLRFLSSGVAKEFGELGMAELLRDIGKEEIFAVGHALSAKSSLEVGQGGRLGEIHQEVATADRSYR